MLVKHFQVMLEFSGDALQVVKNFPEVFLDDVEQPRQLHVAESRDHKVSHRVVLVP